VLDKLSTADLESLPLMVKYILETATPQTIEVIIFKMRERLDFRDLEVAQRQLPETNVPLALILGK
jgi:Fanconi anemia group D2 protein